MDEDVVQWMSEHKRSRKIRNKRNRDTKIRSYWRKDGLVLPKMIWSRLMWENYDKHLSEYRGADNPLNWKRLFDVLCWEYK